MKREDPNDARFDPLLHLAARDERAGVAGACLDAGILGAWAEGALTMAELSAVESHAAGCSRCRALMAAMAETDPQAQAAHAPASEPKPAWWTRPAIRWSVPLAATLAAVIVWAAAENDSDRARFAEVATSRAEAPETTAQPQHPVAKPEEKRQADAPAPQASRSAPAKSAKRATPRPQTAPAPIEARRGQAETVQTSPQPVFLGGAAAPVEAVADDGASRWRILAGGVVERSLDQGRSWQRVASPGPADLVAISARDANNATVRTSAGATLTTADGGRTWEKPRLQENPPAPF